MTVMPEQIEDAVALRYRPGTSGKKSPSLPVSRDSTFGRAGDGALVLSHVFAESWVAQVALLSASPFVQEKILSMPTSSGLQLQPYHVLLRVRDEK